MASNYTPTTSNSKMRCDENERNAKKRKLDQSSSIKQSDFQHEVETTVNASSYLETEKIIALDQIKIVKIVNCTTTRTFWAVVESENFLKSFKESSQCFVLIVDELKFDSLECAAFTDRFPTKVLEGRPFIIQIENSDQTLIFCKESDSFHLRLLIGSEDLENVNTSENVLNLRSVLRALSQHLLCQKVDLKAMVLSHKTVQRFINDEKFIENMNDEIAARFLNIFGPKIENKVHIAAVQNATVGGLAALLELPISYETRDFEISLYQQIRIKLGNLICIAIRHQKTEMLRLLVRMCSETLKPEMQNVSQCAADAKNYEHLVLLIRNDFPFPLDVGNILLGCDFEDLKVICDERKEFMVALENHDVATVEAFIANNLGIKIGFNWLNQMSLTIALRAAERGKNFEMYSLLLYHRFVAIDPSDHAISYAKLTENDKIQIMTECRKFYGRHVESHIFYIYSRTRLGFKSIQSKQSEYFRKIKGYLNMLNKIKDIAPILKVIENSESLNIVFDFDNRSIHKLYLDTDALGICNFHTGHICIGAKAPDNEVSATLAHELTHYAMQIMFDNGAMPFDKGDKDNKTKFESIVNECKILTETQSKIDTVKNVFTSYQPIHYNSELIVRVPEITVEYQEMPEYIDLMAARYPRLFLFYQEHVLENINAFTKDPAKFRNMRNVQEINFRYGNFHFARSFGISKIIEDILEPARIRFIICDVPQLGEASLVEGLQRKMPTREILGSHVFSSISNFKNQYKLQKFNEMETNGITFVLRCEQGDERENHEALWKFISKQNSAKFVFICCSEMIRSEMISLILPNSQIKQTKITHNWTDLPDRLRDELLDLEVSFQGVPLRLKQLVHSDSKSLLKLPLKNLFLKSQQFSIGQRVASSAGYKPEVFIGRMFKEKVKKIQKDMNEPEKADLKWETPISLASLLFQVETKRFIALSDNAGMGKSTIISHIATELKKKFPEKLVLRVNLHDHADDFRNKGFHENLNILMQSNSNFEQLLFSELYNNKKVIFLFDGFDEIAPKSAESFLSFLIKLKESSVSQVWITTRTYLVQDLENKLCVVTYCLIPFNSEEQVNFMVIYWKNKLQIGDDARTKQLEKCAKIVLAHLVQSIRETVLDLMGIPLQTLMLSEIFTKEVQTFLESEPGGSKSFTIDSELPNPNAMYRRFIRRKIEILVGDKGTAVRSEKADLEVEGKDILKVHEHYAMNEIFGIVIDSQYVLGKNVLQRYGIITFTDHTFIHRTFAEYFVARHVASNLRNLNFEILLSIVSNPNDYEILITMIRKEIEHHQNARMDEFYKVIASSLDQVIESNQAVQLLLHKLFREGNPRVMNFFFCCIKNCAKPTLRTLLTSRVSRGENVLMYLSRERIFSRLPFIWHLAKLAYEHEFSSYFLAVDDDGLNAFQITYLVSYEELKVSTDNRLISTLRHMHFQARECLDTKQLEHLIASCNHRKTGIKSEIFVHCDAFQRALSYKFKIASECMADKSAEEIINGDNLFTFAIRFIIDSHHNMYYMSYLLDWVKLKFSIDSYEEFRLKFRRPQEHKKLGLFRD